VAELALELERVVKRWRSGAALRGVDVAVPRGAVVGLVGPTGNLRAPTLRRGGLVVVGYHADSLKELVR